MEWVLKYFVSEVLVIINSIPEECVSFARGSTLGLSVLPLCLSSSCPTKAQWLHPLSQVCLPLECRCLASGLSGTSSITFHSPTLFSPYVFFLINVETGSILLQYKQYSSGASSLSSYYLLSPIFHIELLGRLVYDHRLCSYGLSNLLPLAFCPHHSLCGHLCEGACVCVCTHTIIHIHIFKNAHYFFRINS